MAWESFIGNSSQTEGYLCVDYFPYREFTTFGDKKSTTLHLSIFGLYFDGIPVSFPTPIGLPSQNSYNDSTTILNGLTFNNWLAL